MDDRARCTRRLIHLDLQPQGRVRLPVDGTEVDRITAESSEPGDWLSGDGVENRPQHRRATRNRGVDAHDAVRPWSHHLRSHRTRAERRRSPICTRADGTTSARLELDVVQVPAGVGDAAIRRAQTESDAQVGIVLHMVGDVVGLLGEGLLVDRAAIVGPDSRP